MSLPVKMHGMDCSQIGSTNCQRVMPFFIGPLAKHRGPCNGA